MDKIAKKYGAHSWKPFGPVTTVPSITTGSHKLDAAIGDPNGWPEGSVIEVYGWQGAGKTLLTYLAIAEAQKKYPDRPCAIIDAEKQFVYQAKWAQSFGVNVEELYVSPCVTAEEAFDKCVTAILGEAEYNEKGQPVEIIKPGNFSIIVVDSVSQLTPLVEFQAGMDESTRQAAQAAAIGKGLRKLLSAMQLVNSKTIVFFINQVRSAPMTMGKGPAEGRSGGNALRFYATLICKVKKNTQSVVRDKESGKIVSHDVYVTIEKNKAGQLPSAPISFTLKYDGTGVDNETELFDVALQNNVIDGSVGWYYFINKDGSRDEKIGKFRRAKGERGAAYFEKVLNENPKRREQIYKAIKEGNIYSQDLTLEELEAGYEEVKEDIVAETAVKKRGKKKDVVDEVNDEEPKRKLKAEECLQNSIEVNTSLRSLIEDDENIEETVVENFMEEE